MLPLLAVGLHFLGSHSFGVFFAMLCGLQDLNSLITPPGIEPRSQQWKPGILTTRPSGNWEAFPDSPLSRMIFIEILLHAHSSVGKESACNAGDTGSITGSGRSPGEGNGNPLQYSCLENPKSRGAWQATVYGVTKVRHDLVTKPPSPRARWCLAFYRCLLVSSSRGTCVADLIVSYFCKRENELNPGKIMPKVTGALKLGSPQGSVQPVCSEPPTVLYRQTLFIVWPPPLVWVSESRDQHVPNTHPPHSTQFNVS